MWLARSRRLSFVQINSTFTTAAAVRVHSKEFQVYPDLVGRKLLLGILKVEEAVSEGRDNSEVRGSVTRTAAVQEGHQTLRRAPSTLGGLAIEARQQRWPDPDTFTK